MKSIITKQSAHAKRFTGIVAFLIVGLSAGSAAAMLNPDTVYCRALGYEYFTAHTPKGVVGVCQLTDGQLVNASDFFHGRVALEWSHCAKAGLEAKRDTSGKICRDCLVCVQDNGEEVTAVELMGLSFAESTCGDGHCGTMEDSSSCPDDCPTGGLDELCDGQDDSICDPDCRNLGQDDPDCDDDKPESGSGCGCQVNSDTTGASGKGVLFALGLAMILRRRCR